MAERIDVEGLIDDVKRDIEWDPHYGERGEGGPGLNALATLAREIDRLREIEEAARGVVREHDEEFGEEPWASDPDPYDQAIDRLRTALADHSHTEDEDDD